MISKSKHLVGLARSFAARGQVDERHDVVILRGTFLDEREQADWMDLRDDPPPPFDFIQLYDVAISGDVGRGEAFARDRGLTIQIKKPAFDQIVAFIFERGVVSYLLQEPSPVNKIVCVELVGSANFSARGLEVADWDVDKPLSIGSQPIKIDPRPFVRDLVPEREIAEDLSPWISGAAPSIETQIYRVWQDRAARKLLGALVDTAAVEDGQVRFSISGPPRWHVQADDHRISGAISSIDRAVRWVYCSGDDKDVRHFLCACEIARAGRPEESLSTIVEIGLESAQAAYEAHVQSSSKETLKALADLRKTIVEDTQKVTERTRGLTSDLWRDVAVTSAPFVVKELQDTAGSNHFAIQAIFYFGAAVFIALSFWMQIRINSSFFEDQGRARTHWLETLYKYVSAGERKKIAEEPINDAIRNYKEIRTIIGSLYAFLIFILVTAGIRAASS